MEWFWPRHTSLEAGCIRSNFQRATALSEVVYISTLRGRKQEEFTTETRTARRRIWICYCKLIIHHWGYQKNECNHKGARRVRSWSFVFSVLSVPLWQMAVAEL